MKTRLGLCAFGVGFATLLGEVQATRLFSLAQGYHFAFLAVGLALLGLSAGSVLAAAWPPQRRAAIAASSVAAGLAYPLCFRLANAIPVDLYAVAWSTRNLCLLAAAVAAMVIPFLLSGLVLARCLQAARDRAGAVYAANLVGSAAGALAAVLLAEGRGPFTLLALACAALGVFGLSVQLRLLVPLLVVAGILSLGLPWDRWLSARLSPYRPLAQAMHAHGVVLNKLLWAQEGLLAVVEGPTLRAAAGLPLSCPSAVPRQRLVYLNADEPRAVSIGRAQEALAVSRCLPLSAVGGLGQRRLALILQPASDLQVAATLSWAERVVVAEPRRALLRAWQDPNLGSPIFSLPSVESLTLGPRAALRRVRGVDAVVVPLRHGFRPISWGATGLSEDYTLTVEALHEAMQSLSPDGIVVVEGWLHEPPSESLRLWLTLLAALRKEGVAQPGAHLAAVRSMETILILAGRQELSGQAIASFRQACAERELDLVWLADLQPAEQNRYNVLARDFYAEAFAALLNGPGLAESYPLDIRPATDERPFPEHFFRYEQVPLVLAQFGKSAELFGGLGFLILPLMLALSAFLGAGLVVLPVLAGQRPPSRRSLAAFALCGVGYVAVQLPLVQMSMLALPTAQTALAAVISAMLGGSGLASAIAQRHPSHLWPVGAALTALAQVLVGLDAVQAALGLPEWAQRANALVLAGITGFGLGGVFVVAMQRFAAAQQERAWALAANGAASVVGSALVTITGMTWGVQAPLLLGMCCYLGCALLVGHPRAVAPLNARL